MSFVNTFPESIIVRNLTLPADTPFNSVEAQLFRFPAAPGGRAWVGSGTVSTPTNSQYLPVTTFGADKQILFSNGQPNTLVGDSRFLYDYSTQTFSIPQITSAVLISNYTYGAVANTLRIGANLNLTTANLGTAGGGIQVPERRYMRINAGSGGTGVSRTTLNNYGSQYHSALRYDVAGGGASVINYTQLSISSTEVTKIVNTGSKTKTYILDYHINWQDSGAGWDSGGGASYNTTNDTYNGTGYSGRRSAVIVKNRNWSTEMYGYNQGKWNDGQGGGSTSLSNGSCAFVLAPNDYIELYVTQSSSIGILYPSSRIFIVEI